MSEAKGGHIPVLLNEVVRAADLSDGDIVVDGTFGAGGYSRGLLDSANVQVIAIDRDPDALERAKVSMQEYEDRFQIIEGCFGDMDALLKDAGQSLVDVVVLDIGVSSFQIDEAERGFSFMRDGPLDMRMSATGLSAADVVNTWDEEDLANIIYKFGDEPRSRRIASAIVTARESGPITRTLELGNIIQRAIGQGPARGRNASRSSKGNNSMGKRKIHPATKAFQALRIFVNDELGELGRGLIAAERLLKPGGRLLVVSFHSLEDRMVKTFMSERSGRVPALSRHVPVSAVTGPEPTFSLLKKGAIKPSDEETRQNPRSRSSRLRVAVRTEAPVWEAAA